MVPLRFVAEITGAEVEWHAEKQKVLIRYPDDIVPGAASQNEYNLEALTYKPVEYSIDDERNVIISDKVIHQLWTAPESSVGEALIDVFKIDNKDMYMVQTKIGEAMSHNFNDYHLISGNRKISILSQAKLEVWSLSDKFLFVKSRRVGAHYVSIYNMDTGNETCINDIISKYNIENFEVKGNRIIIEANDINFAVDIYEDENQRFELNLDEILIKNYMFPEPQQ